MTDLPVAHYGVPGQLRDRLVAAILDGSKTSTTSLAEDYRRAGEPLPKVGDREAVVDSAGRVVCSTVVDAVVTCRLADVTIEHVREEGEGHHDVAAWRADHEAFWTSAQPMVVSSAQETAIDDDTEIVCVTFTVER